MIDASVETAFPFIAEQRGQHDFADNTPVAVLLGIPTAHATRLDIFLQQTTTLARGRIVDVTVRTWSQGREIYVGYSVSGAISSSTAAIVVAPTVDANACLLGDTTDVLVTVRGNVSSNVVTCWAVARS